MKLVDSERYTKLIDRSVNEVLITLFAGESLKVDLQFVCNDAKKQDDLGSLSMQKLIDTISLDVVYLFKFSI